MENRASKIFDILEPTNTGNNYTGSKYKIQDKRVDQFIGDSLQLIKTLEIYFIWYWDSAHNLCLPSYKHKECFE